MAKTISQLVSVALDSVGAYGKAVADIRATLKGRVSPEEVRVALLPPVAAYYGVKLVQKERGEGVTWDKDAPKFETAKKAHQRLVADVLGKTSASKDELEIPEEIIALARKLVKACEGYEIDGKSVSARMVATAVALAKQ